MVGKPHLLFHIFYIKRALVHEFPESIPFQVLSKDPFRNTNVPDTIINQAYYFKMVKSGPSCPFNHLLIYYPFKKNLLPARQQHI